MKNIYLILIFVVCAFTACKNEVKVPVAPTGKSTNTIKYAKGLELYKYEGFTVVRVTRPWPGARESYTYVMQRRGATIPDSLKRYTLIPVPLKRVVVTSTTHIPSLEMLGVENTLVGFPGTGYVSSQKTRARIDSRSVKEAGPNESLNTEVVIDLAPDAVVAFGINNSNKTLASLQQSGIKVVYNGDWTEQSPLGKAEWIKFFGALYGKEDKANAIFSKIEKDYNKALKLVQHITAKPTVMAGALYHDQWYLPQGSSWAALFIKDAGGDYLWAASEGTGSLGLSFETVLDKAQDADFWIGPSQFTSLKEMTAANPHYARFRPFKNKEVYSFSTKKGATGGLLYYELAPNRPDLVLKDLICIVHPELLPGYELQFFEKLK